MAAVRVVLAGLLALAAGACKEDPETVIPVALEPKLSAIQSDVFNNDCSSSTCHGTGAGNLTLEPGTSYSQLVNVRSTYDGAHTPQFYRVRPGVPDSSFLMVKITHPGSSQGDQMPAGGGTLTQEQINAIRTWISNGAQNN